jgi:E3 ubiquitin-protein ligase UBR1
VQPPRKVLSPAAPVPGVEGVKKRAAKAREEVIMAELQAQQASFSLNLEEKEEENVQDMDETFQISSFNRDAARVPLSLRHVTCWRERVRR